MSKQQYEVFKAAGLIDPTKVTTDKGGRINAQPGAIVGSLEHSDNLYDWAQSIRGPLMNLAKGDPKVFESLLAKIGRNRNSIKLLTMFTDPGFGDQIAKDIAIWSQAMGGDEAYNAMVGRPDKIVSQMQLSGGIGARDKQGEDAAKMADYTAVMKAFQAQWESLMMAVGGPVARGLTPMLQGLTTELNKAANWAEKHPDAIKYIAEGAAAIAGAMVVLGGAAVIAGAAALLPGGIVALSIAGISLAISAMAAMNWGAVATGFNVLVEAISRFFALIEAVPGKLGFAGAPSIIPSSWGDSVFAAKSLAHSGYARGGLEREMGRESARGIGMPPPVVNANTKVDVKVLVDGKSIAAIVQTNISRDNRSVDSSSGHDGRADWSPTDANSFH